MIASPLVRSLSFLAVMRCHGLETAASPKQWVLPLANLASALNDAAPPLLCSLRPRAGLVRTRQRLVRGRQKITLTRNRIGDRGALAILLLHQRSCCCVLPRPSSCARRAATSHPTAGSSPGNRSSGFKAAMMPPRMAHGIRPKTGFHHRSRRDCECHLCWSPTSPKGASIRPARWIGGAHEKHRGRSRRDHRPSNG
jgi:hypothetical protein